MKTVYDRYREPRKCQICGILTGGEISIGISRDVDKIELARRISDMRNDSRCAAHEWYMEFIDSSYTDEGTKPYAYAWKGLKRTGHVLRP